MNDIEELLNELINLEDQKINKSIKEEKKGLEKKINGIKKIINNGLVPQMRSVLKDLIKNNEQAKNKSGLEKIKIFNSFNEKKN